MKPLPSGCSTGIACRGNGLLVADNGGGTITLFPPLTIDRESAAAGLDILERST